jgi:DNA-directed RNA polymerase subunit N (RpoN/RPB10)
MSVSPMRCWCGREIQRPLTRYHELLKKGFSRREALDNCGLPLRSAFQTEADYALAPTPPPVCCRSIIMANVDLNDQYSMFQFVISHGEGMEAVGGKSKIKMTQQNQLPLNITNNNNTSSNKTKNTKDKITKTKIKTKIKSQTKPLSSTPPLSTSSTTTLATLQPLTTATMATTTTEEKK